MVFSLDRLPLHRQAFISHLEHTSAIRRRLADLGFQSGAAVQCVGVSPLGDPRAYLICGAVIALRTCDCKDIFVRYPQGGA